MLRAGRLQPVGYCLLDGQCSDDRLPELLHQLHTDRPGITTARCLLGAIVKRMSLCLHVLLASANFKCREVAAIHRAW